MKKIFFKKLKAAFSELESLGWFAKGGFADCMSCSWAEIDDETAKKAVFYHQQDYESYKFHKGTYLAFSQELTDDELDELKNIIEKHDLVFNWDGNRDNRILVQ